MLSRQKYNLMHMHVCVILNIILSGKLDTTSTLLTTVKIENSFWYGNLAVSSYTRDHYSNI